MINLFFTQKCRRYDDLVLVYLVSNETPVMKETLLMFVAIINGLRYFYCVFNSQDLVIYGSMVVNSCLQSGIVNGRLGKKHKDKVNMGWRNINQIRDPGVSGAPVVLLPKAIGNSKLSGYSFLCKILFHKNNEAQTAEKLRIV